MQEDLLEGDVVKNENGSPRRRGRKKKNTGRETQHVIYMDPELWDAAGDLPETRQDIAREAFLNKVAYYHSDLPKLKWQLEEIRARIQSDMAKEAVILLRIEQLEAKAIIEVNDVQKAEDQINLVVKETLTMCKAFKKDMGFLQYTKLSDMSGVEAAKIEVFLKDAKFRPSEEAVRVFYSR